MAEHVVGICKFGQLRIEGIRKKGGKKLLTIEQLEKHNKYITGSKVASILGISPYKSKWQLFAEMHGDIAVENVSTTRMKMGSYAEVSMTQYCEKELGWNLIEGPENGKFHPKYPFLWGLVDRLQRNANKELSCVVEFKNVDKFQRSMWIDENGLITPPDYYQAQLYFYMQLWDLPGRFFTVFGGNEPVVVDLPRNLEIEEFIIEECCKFWDDLQNDRYPEPDGSESCTQTLAKMFAGNDDKMIFGTQESLIAAQEYEQARQAEKEAEERKNLAGNKLRAAIGNHTGLVLPDGGKVTWKMSKDRLRFDEKRFTTENPELAKKYYDIVPGYRTLRVSLGKI